MIRSLPHALPDPSGPLSICNLPTAIRSSSIACSAAASFTATIRSCRPASARNVPNASSECLTTETGCSPLGRYLPANQFFTVFSFAPVQDATTFALALLYPRDRR